MTPGQPKTASLAHTLAPMTALQASVALGIFALATLAPQMGLSVARLGALNTLLFGIGAVAAFSAGRLIERFGAAPLASACALAIAIGMLCLAVGGADAAWLAVLFFGLAFGPETPASAALLSAVTPARRRPLVFSVRQTGNQIGAIAGSLCLPALLALHPRLPFAAVVLMACGVALWCARLARTPSRDDAAARHGSALSAGTGAPTRPWPSSWRLDTPPLRLLATATLLFSAMQMCLNVFLMSHAVRSWGMPVGEAAGWVALLQAGGLVGRIAWGAWAQRLRAASRLLGCIGMLAALAGTAVVAAPLAHEGWLFASLVAGLGFCASGWNGVLVAETARLAGPHRAGALSGTLLGYGYVGLAAAPSAFAWMGESVSTGAAFLALFGLAGVAGAALMLTRAGAPSPY